MGWIDEKLSENQDEAFYENYSTKNGKTSAIQQYAQILLNTGMYEHAARVFAILGNKKDAIRSLDRRQSSFNKVTKSIGLPSLTCLIVRLSLLEDYCKTSFMTVFSFVVEINGANLVNNVLGFYKELEIDISPLFQCFCFLLMKLDFQIDHNFERVPD